MITPTMSERGGENLQAITVSICVVYVTLEHSSSVIASRDVISLAVVPFII